MTKVVANKEVYTNIANSSWKKEDELRALKGEAAELDRKIALTLAPAGGGNGGNEARRGFTRQQLLCQNKKMKTTLSKTKKRIAVCRVSDPSGDVKRMVVFLSCK